ncbi:N-acyl homoserine lactonase family protein [Shimazuella sp. AN120528]|uniref:N-acyl homoserine lactonase family protein n=1 Tax=Shimazuella soli TaxID=1892854 RepID=UPI001F0D4A9A|nr:N-acyl homoserine lactonase family protein [Shimazuella soli]MCH5585002.1 N-acyl homoserine lactonase family protein [Shimazuella soli]
MNNFVKVHVMHCGDVKVDRRLAYRDPDLDHIPFIGQRSEEYQPWLPVSCYLIEHPKGTVVIDAGWSEDVRTRPEVHLGHAYKFCHPRLPSGQSISEQLASKGLTLKSIDYVVISHMDIDHISGIHLLADAKSFLVSEPEWNGAKSYQKARCEGVVFESFSLDPIPFGPYQLGKDLFGDGLVYLVFTPGHTAGLVSVVARVENGWLLLAADAGYSKESWNQLILPGNTSNEQQALQSLQWISDFSKRDDCVAVIANHDPSVKYGIY